MSDDISGFQFILKQITPLTSFGWGELVSATWEEIKIQFCKKNRDAYGFGVDNGFWIGWSAFPP